MGSAITRRGPFWITAERTGGQNLEESPGKRRFKKTRIGGSGNRQAGKHPDESFCLYGRPAPAAVCPAVNDKTTQDSIRPFACQAPARQVSLAHELAVSTAGS
jgi:hypothetical protein